MLLLDLTILRNGMKSHDARSSRFRANEDRSDAKVLPKWMKERHCRFLFTWFLTFHCELKIRARNDTDVRFKNLFLNNCDCVRASNFCRSRRIHAQLLLRWWAKIVQIPSADQRLGHLAKPGLR
jgi:hypothetical protein